MRTLSIFSRPRLAIDVGTAVTRACSESSPILESPSLARRGHGDGEESPILRGGVVCDIAAAAEVIERTIGKLSRGWQRPAAIVCAPSDATRIEKEALVEAVTTAGAAVASVVAEPLAAAIGSGIDVSSEYANLIVDIGEGVTDVAIIRDGALIRNAALRTGCGDVRRVLFDWFEWQHDLSIDRATANALVAAFCGTENLTAFGVRGRNASGAQATLNVASDELAAVIEPAIENITGFVANMFKALPNDIAVEVIENGLHVSGGGAALDLLVRRIERATGLTVYRPDDPYRSVIRGARQMLHHGVVSESMFV